MLLADLAAASDAVSATPSRTAKITLIAALLGRSGPRDVDLVVRYLAGEIRQRRTGVGAGALRALPPPAPDPSLSLAEVDGVFSDLASMSGRGSATARHQLFGRLMGKATASEQRLLAGLVSGELRQGAAAGVMTEAVAAAGAVPVVDVRSAVTVTGSLPEVARVLTTSGPTGLGNLRLRLGTPLAPMLAQSASTVSDAVDRLPAEEPVGVEWKLDGIRVQIHRDRGEVAVFSRSGDDLTDRLPELVEQVRGFPAQRLLLDGEAIVLRADGRPERFQVTGSRVARTVDVDHARRESPLRLFAFDALHVDGQDLLDEPATRRWALLEGCVPADARIPRLVTDDPVAAADFVEDALRRGHEGGVLKSASSRYSAGRRGAAWVKVKPRILLDLVVLAAEWGHGRRRGWLSNLHLGARDPIGGFGEAGGFVMLGKTFKGMTDATLAWQTKRLRDLAEGPVDDWVVRVRPELVVETAVDGVQASPRYPGGVALRFARVVRYREDKRPGEVDTIDTVRDLLT